MQIILGPYGGGGQAFNVLTFHSDDSSSNPAEVYNFPVKIIVEKGKNEQVGAL